MKTFSADGNIEPFATKNLTTNEILVAGRCTVSPNGNYKAMVVKLSVSGKLIWSYAIGGDAQDMFTGIQILSDGSYLIFGTSTSFGYPNGKILLVRLNTDGTLISSRILGLDANSVDRIKDIKQYTDGDLIGTFNNNDSTNSSSPIVFKIGLDGTLKWARTFDNNGAESFTTINFYNNIIYLNGFITNGKKLGVITQLNLSDGTLISSVNPYYIDTSLDQEVKDLEIYNNEISYQIWINRLHIYNPPNKFLLIKKDLKSGKVNYKTLVDNSGDSTNVIIKRNPEEGFYVLRNYYYSAISKFNRYNYIEWSNSQNSFIYSSNSKNLGFDLTNSGGTVSAGYYSNYSTSGKNTMTLAKSTSLGPYISSCANNSYSYFTDTVTQFEHPFIWVANNLITLNINQNISCSISNFMITPTNNCDTVLCVNKTPLPQQCNKTSLLDYALPSYSAFRDAVLTDDGGKIIIGDVGNPGYAGLILKIKKNGEVAWSFSANEFDKNMKFFKILKSGNDFIAFANVAYGVNHGAYRSSKLIKFDTNGNVLLVKDLTINYFDWIGDVTILPDGGLVLVFNGCLGCGGSISVVVRLDNNFNILWKKELKHNAAVPIYKSIACTSSEVYIAHDSYDNYNQNLFGLEKLDLNSGNEIWNYRFKVKNSTVSINKIYLINDTIYLFINRWDSTSTNISISMVKIDSKSNIINGSDFPGNTIASLPFDFRWDVQHPTVTLTASNNFLTANQLNTPNGNLINLTAFDKEGTPKWSKNYPNLTTNYVMNVIPNVSGFIITGTVKGSNNSNLTNSFILSTDSVGEIITGPSGNCKTQITTISKTNLVVTKIDSRIDSIVNYNYFQIVDGIIRVDSIIVIPTLYCSQPVKCNPVVLSKIGTGCSLNDTLTFYLANNQCGAMAKWQYDSSFLNVIQLNSDTIIFVPKKTGVTLLTAQIADFCSTYTQSNNVSILQGASLLNLGNDTVICPGTKIILHAGPGYVSYKWNDQSTDSLLTVSSPGLYFVQVVDNCGKIARDSIKIDSLSKITLQITGNAEKCNNDSVLLTASSGFNNYHWSPNSNGIFVNNSAKVNPSQTTLYILTAEKIAGCNATTSFLLTVLNSPPINLGNDTSICNNDSINLIAPKGFTNYNWSTGSNSASISVFASGTYFVSAIYSNSCISADTIQIFKLPFTPPFLGADTSICSNSNFELSPGNYKQYLWNDGSTGRNLQIFAAGKYWVKTTDINGCIGNDSINIITIYNSPQNFLLKPISICFGENAKLASSKNFEKYLWSDGSTNPSLAINNPGLYNLTVTDAYGCNGKDSINVTLKNNCLDTMFIMNAFTPNNDGLNDVFKPIIWGQLEMFSLNIYNQFGQIIFSTSNPNIGWDGSFYGQPQKMGNYIFSCNYKFIGHSKAYKSGNLILIR